MQSIKANIVRTIRTMASAFRTRTVRVFPFWMQSVKANVVQTTHAMASAFWMSVFAIRTQCILQMQSVKANGIQTKLTMAHHT